MRIDSPQSVGIISGFGIPTGGTINQVLSKVDSDNYDTQWTTVSGSSGSSISFSAATNITIGNAVSLDTNGRIVSTDFDNTLPIIGIAQQSGTTGSVIRVSVEGNVSNVHTGLISGREYYSNNTGVLGLTGSTYVGIALSPTQINVSFSNPDNTTTVTPIAAANITRGYAVRQKDNGEIIPTDYTEFGTLNSGTFGGNSSGAIQDVTYVNATNQNLALGFTNNLPILYVGTVDTTTFGISYGTGIQLSTVPLLSNTEGVIHYDETQGRALVAYPMSGNQINVISINRSGTSYAVGVVQAITFAAVTPTEVRISSNNSNRFYLSCLNSNLNTIVKSLDVGSSFIVTMSTSPSAPNTQSTHGLVWYKTDRVALIFLRNGTLSINAWNTSTNQWIGANVPVIILPSPLGQIKFDAFNGNDPQNFIAAWVGQDQSYVVSWTFSGDISIANRRTSSLEVTGTPNGVWMPNINNLFYSVTFATINNIVRSTNIPLLNVIGLNAATTVYSTFANDGFFQDTNGTYYGLGFNSGAPNRILWDSFGTRTFTNLPVIGIAQQSGVAGDKVIVAIENSISNAHSGLTPTTNYFMNANGSLETTGVVYLGYALSDNELNVLFHNPPGSLTTSNWSLSSGYSQNDLVINQRSIYQANSIIPPNTAFVVGTTGTTWSQIGSPVPSGGTTGQILRKVNNTDYNTEWYGLSYASILFNSLNTNANQDQTPVLGPANGITVVGNTMVISRPGIYSLNANLAFRAGFVEYRWVDSSNTQLVGTNVGVTGSLTSTEAVSPSPAAGIVNITSPNTVIKLRNGNVSTIGTQVPGYAIATITQIA